MPLPGLVAGRVVAIGSRGPLGFRVPSSGFREGNAQPETRNHGTRNPERQASHPAPAAVPDLSAIPSLLLRPSRDLH
jgi:hypothetical protein